MSRSRVIGLVKLAVVAGLLWFVFATVQWDDSYRRVGPDGEVAVELSGEILGRWDEKTVRFQPFGEDGRPIGEVISVDQESRVESVSPGFMTCIVNLDWLLFAAGALLYCLTVNVAGIRWWWLLRVNQLDVSRWTAIRYTWIGLFFNNIVPGQTGGDVVKAIYIMKHCEGGRMAALVSVGVDRILGLGSLAILGAIVVLFALDREGFGNIAIGIWGVLALVAVLGTVAFSKRIRKRINLKGLLERLPDRLNGLLQKVDQAVYFYRGHKRGILLWMLIGVGNHAVSVTSTMLIGEALGVGLPAMVYFVLVPVINIVSAFPIAPNGWGVGEFAYKFLFGNIGASYLTDMPRATAVVIMGTRGLALSLLWRIHLTLWSLVGGLFVLFEREKVTRADIESEVAGDPAN